MKIEQLHELFLTCSGISTDTRKIEKNNLFVALKGDNFDANTFTIQAIEMGAKYVLIDNETYYINETTILVDDTLKTLQNLAQFHRKKLGTKIIGLTGSNGKTTTKELINCVLSSQYKTIATIGNLNNHIGVPLTLLRLKNDTEIGIIEMGANHQKEIEFLSNIALPDYGYITNFGKAHLEGFGGVEGVIKGKSELYDYLRTNKKIALINYDDTLQLEKSVGIETIGYSFTNNQGLKIKEIKADPMVEIVYDDTVIKTNLIGIYNANNINAAIAFGKEFQISNAKIKSAIESYSPSNNRSQITVKNTNEIILDAYNANPSSMEVALLNFNQLTSTNKIAILGDMFELGDESSLEHKKIIEKQKENTSVTFYFVGEHFFKEKIEHENMEFYKDFESFKNALSKKKIQQSNILIKGSRGMALERTLEYI